MCESEERKFGADCGAIDWEMLRQIQPKLLALGHPYVQIYRIADVVALQKREPRGVPSRGCGSVASQAYKVPASVFVMFAPEGKKSSVEARN